MVLAYGSWGTIAGRGGAACNKGNPPCIGVGLMRKLAKRFVVAITPEQYTSKTCCRCMGQCGPHPTMQRGDGREIRGLRVCQNEDCKLLQNRDRTGGTEHRCAVWASLPRSGADPVPELGREGADAAPSVP